MITRSYSPPFQARAPKRGADDMGRVVKALVSVEVARSSEVSFAAESFGCDGKPVLSPLRGLACEVDGRLAVSGTKNGMPFRLGAELPRGLGSAIRGAGGGMVRVTGGAAMLSTEWVLYDSVGNHWSLDQGTTPVYLGATPPLANGDGVTPATCVQDPKIRPYELRWEYVSPGGEGPDEAFYHWAGAGWIEDASGGPVIASPIAYPYVVPSSYWRVEQYIPDETAYPAGAVHAACWPTSRRIVEVLWYPERVDTPLTWASDTDNSIDVLMTQYGSSPPWRYFANRGTRPLIEHVSIGANVGEDLVLACVEKNGISLSSRIALRDRGTGTLLASSGTYAARTDARHMFTPDKSEGFLLQTGDVIGDTVQMRRYHTRTSPSANYGTALSYQGVYNVTLPAAAAVPWPSEPVWFRVGQVSRTFGSNARLTPRLPRW